MRLITFLALFSTAFFSSLAVEPDGTVHKLTEETFDQFVKEDKLTLVEFFAPWCGHCKQLAPEYEKAARVLSEAEKDIRLANVDCTTNQEVCKKMEISGYPTFKLFKSGVAREYGGTRSAEGDNGIINYMKRQLKPANSPVSSDKLSEFSKSDTIVIVSKAKKDSPLYKVFNEVAEILRDDYTFGTIEDGENSVVMYKKFEDPPAKYAGEITREAITNWVKRESIPLMDEISQNNYEKYMTSGLPLAFLFYSNQDEREKVGEVVKKVMKEYKGKINAVYIDATKFGAYGESLNLEKEWPGFVIHDIENDLKYPFNHKDGLTESNLSKFVKGFVSGELKPKYKSEPIPKSDDSPVKTIVHETFEKIVLDEKKDVLIELYAPWCGACKRISPTYEKLAKAYGKHADKIVIAKMDATTNDVPKSAKIKLEKFPTIFLFKAGTNEKIELEHASDDIKVFTEFISKHATNKVEPELTGETESKDKSTNGGEHEEL